MRTGLSTLAVMNVLGLAGLSTTVVAVGTLTGWRWALLLAGPLMTAVSYLGSRTAVPPVVVAGASAPAATPPAPRRLESVGRAA